MSAAYKIIQHTSDKRTAFANLRISLFHLVILHWFCCSIDEVPSNSFSKGMLLLLTALNTWRWICLISYSIPGMGVKHTLTTASDPRQKIDATHAALWPGPRRFLNVRQHHFRRSSACWPQRSWLSYSVRVHIKIKNLSDFLWDVGMLIITICVTCLNTQCRFIYSE